jgi:hypothetical protein
MRVLGAIVVFNTIVLAFLIGTKWRELTRPAPKALRSATAFEGTTKIPAEEISAAFNGATKAKDDANRNGNLWNSTAYVLDWIAFALSTAIAAIAAFFGEPAADNAGDAAAQLAQLRARARTKSWIVGIVAAAISASTAFGNRAHAESKAAYKWADDIVAAMDQTRMIIDNPAATQTEQRRALQKVIDLASRTGG